MSLPSLDLHSLQQAYRAGTSPADILDAIYDRIAERGDDHVWIHLVPRAEARIQAERQRRRLAAGADLPLYGVPFAVKDNLDVAGLPTTAACPAFRYVADRSAPVIERLLEAGAIILGKTNLDQFATGLVGVRSPYGACASVFDSRYISGGSSSGSSVAVAAGLVSFALGTDTAGSGRIPAAFNNLVGWKPTRGLLSNTGLVPACRSLDCISVLSLTCADARTIGRVVGRFDPDDPYSRRAPAAPPALPTAFRFGVPAAHQLEFFGDAGSAALFGAAVARLEGLGGTRVEIDYAPFLETAELLYEGPWVAERLAAIQGFFERRPDAFHPVTARIIGGGSRYTAVDTFQSFYQLEALRRKTEAEWSRMDVLVLPTAGTAYTIAEVEADPIQLNTNLGHYTNFVNLLDLCAVAVPAGFRADGLPFGITLVGPTFADDALCALGGRYHQSLGGPLGGTSAQLAALPPPEPAATAGDDVHLAVVGAHLSGQPLNGQLTSRSARLLRATRTASGYRLFSLRNTVPPKPGLVRAPGFSGPGIAVEVWALSPAAFGAFVAEVPAPMTIGTIDLADGSRVKSFLCEPYAVEGSEEITLHGGWIAYRNQLAAPP
jgi:allophanate hydrolase